MSEKNNAIIEQAVKALSTVQDTIKKFDGKLDALENDKVNKATEAATKALEAKQAMELKIEAMEKKAKEQDDFIKELEVSIKAGNTPLVDPKDAVKKSSDYSNAFCQFIRKGIGPGGSLNPFTDEMIAKEATSMVDYWTKGKGVPSSAIEMMRKDLISGIGEDGGYMIRPERSNWISERIFETSPMRSISNVETTMSNEYEVILDDDEFSANWVEEVGTRAETDTSKIGKIKIPVNEIMAYPKATQRQLDDAGMDVESWISKKIVDIFTRSENTAFVNGDGSGKPLGFLQYSAWASAGTYQRNAIETRTSITAGSFEASDLIDLQTDLLETYQDGASWVMHRKTFADVMKLTGDDGQFLLNPRLLAEGARLVLLGAPVRFMSDMPVPASLAQSIAYGNFMMGYTIVDRYGIRVIRDPYTLPGYVKFNTTKRVGGRVTNFQAIKVLKCKVVT